MTALEWLDAVRADLDAVSRFGDELTGRVSSQSGRSVVAISGDLHDAYDALDSTAPDRLDRMERALRGVMDMHRRSGCREPWDTCPTMAAIEEALA